MDSAASVPDEFWSSSLTFVAPMRLSVGNETFIDGVDISPGEFYERQARTSEGTSTSAPTPADFLSAYIAASEVAESAIAILVSGAFSASNRSADIALERFRQERPNFEIRNLDSRSAAGGQGLIAWEALRSAGAGASLEQVEARALETRDEVRLLAYVDTLYYLWRGGRVLGIAHLGASLLKIKPIFELRQSEIIRLANPRTERRARARMIELMAERVGESRVHAIVMHAAAAERADSLRSAVDMTFDCAEVHLTEFTPVMGAHIGPGMVGVAFRSETRGRQRI